MVCERFVWAPALDTARSTLRTDCVTEVLRFGAREGVEPREAGTDVTPAMTVPVVPVLAGPVAVLPVGTDSPATNPGACSLRPTISARAIATASHAVT